MLKKGQFVKNFRKSQVYHGVFLDEFGSKSADLALFDVNL